MTQRGGIDPMWGQIQIVTAIALVTAALGCSDDRPPIREASDHLILRVPSDLEVCGGTFSTMESEVIRLRGLFGATPGPVDYAWMPRTHYASEDFPCMLSIADGCASGLNVYDRSIANTHELVHAARAAMPAAFEEGLATLLAPANRPVQALAPRDELLDALRGSLRSACNSSRIVRPQSASPADPRGRAWQRCPGVEQGWP